MRDYELTSIERPKPKGRNERRRFSLLLKALTSSLSEAARLASDLNQARRSDAQKGDHIIAAQSYLGDIYTLIEGYKHSLAEKDDEILCRVQGELLSLAASAGFERGLHMDRTKEQLDAAIKKISYFVHGAHVRLIEATLLKLAHLEVVPASQTTRVSPSLTKESTVTLVLSSLEFPSNDVSSSSVAVVPTEVIMHGVIHRVCDDVTPVESSLTQDSGLVPPAPSDIIVS
ncbi:hypothetical protein Tco_0536178 [Tanacetum coccineum]